MIPIQNLFYILCYAWNVLSIRDPYNLLGHMFSFAVGKLIKQGFYRCYRTTEEELSVLKVKSCF